MIRKNIIFDLSGVLFAKDVTKPGTMVPIDEGVQILRSCAAHKRGHQLFVCSNMGAKYLSQIHRDYPDIMKLFKGVVTPQIALAEKPNPEIFMYLLKQYQLNPDESLFLDDNEINITAVERLGLIGIHVVDFKLVYQELKRLHAL